jgi:hypothetical protein
LKLAIVGNNSSIGKLLTDELRRRGHDIDLYSAYNSTVDNSGFNLAMRHNSLAGMALRQAQLSLKRHLNTYDIQLIIGGQEPIGLKARRTIHYHGSAALRDQYPYGYKPDCFIASLDLQDIAPNSVLLPRPVNAELFKTGRKRPRMSETPRVGHFWRRGRTTIDYAMRWFKDTDRLLDALHMGKFQLVDRLVSRELFPHTLASVDVLAEQFRVGSYGLPAIESLISETPVVGYYRKDLVECPEAYEMIHATTRDPNNIYLTVESAVDSLVGSTKAVEDYHSAKHSVDVFEDTLKRWHLSW